MQLAQRIANFFHAEQSTLRPKPGQLIRTREEDAWRDYPADGLTPSRLSAILKAADDGVLSEPMQLYEQMEEKDAHLFSIANTRRLALTGLEWEIVPASDLRPGLDAALARDAADYCEQVLGAIETLDEALQHLSLALGRNIAVAEVVWDFVDRSHTVVEVVPVDFTRLVLDRVDRIRILTDDEPHDGILCRRTSSRCTRRTRPQAIRRAAGCCASRRQSDAECGFSNQRRDREEGK